MKKYRQPLTNKEKEELNRLSKLNFSGWSEADVREDFIAPLLLMLGYRKELDYSVSRADSYKLNPLFLQVGSKRIELDYMCSVRKNKFWIIEAKNGGEDTYPEILRTSIEQAHFYSLHPEINTPYFIVTNGWYINIYERDKVDEFLTPILSVKKEELPEKYLRIDHLIGSTQILPFLKQRQLDCLESILSAEIHLDRLEEFSNEIKRTIAKVRPKVLNNFRENAKKQKENNDEKAKGYKKYIIENEEIYLVPYSLFMSMETLGSIRDTCHLVVDKIRKTPSSKQYLFFNNLLLEKMHPVTMTYYVNVLYFLIEFYKSDIILEQSLLKDKKVMLYSWINMLLFHFVDRIELRYLWIFEGLANRLFKRLAISSNKKRQHIMDVISKEIFLIPEESVAWMGPNPAKKIIMFTEDMTLRLLGGIVNKYYDEEHRRFKEVLAYQEFEKMFKVVNEIEEETDKEYKKLLIELGSEWGDLCFFEHINNPWDKLGSGVCGLLKNELDILNELSELSRKRIQKMANIGDINYADDCCKALKLNYTKGSCVISTEDY